MSNKKICVLPGDGIGKEITEQTVRLLKELKLPLEFEFADLGGKAVDLYDTPYPETTQKLANQADAVLLGAVGGPKWDNLPRNKRPEKGLLAIRQDLQLFANLRPAILYKELANASTLKPEVVAGLDILIVRELTGDIYFEAAMKRNKKVCSIDKMNVLETTQLWRDVVTEEAKKYPEVELSHMLVDNAAMQLVRNPKQFDVMLTGNIFGDILSDEASMLTGSIGMLPSASLNETNKGLFEPSHGSAPDIAGKNLANPLATILSAAMMLRYSLGYEAEALLIENAVKLTLEKGFRTADIFEAGTIKVGTVEMTDAVIKSLDQK